MNPHRVAIHESGHAAAYLCRGHRVAEIRLDGVGNGYCRAAGWVPAIDRLFAAHAGALAEQLAGYGDAEMSAGDIDVFSEAARDTHFCGDDLVRRKQGWSGELAQHLDVIESLTEYLRLPRNIGPIGFARLASKLYCPMQKFAHLYAADIAALPAIDAELQKQRAKEAAVYRDREVALSSGPRRGFAAVTCSIS